MKNRVSELRKLYGVRQEAFAEAMGVSRQSIGSIENGRYNPSTELAIRIAHYFGLRVEDVFLTDDTPAWLTLDLLKSLPDDHPVMRNRAHNLEIPLPEGEPIIGQGNRFPSQFAYATFTTAHNGAEPIALYNALLFLGRGALLADVLTELEGNGLPLLEGYAGTDPHDLARYLDAHGVDYATYTAASELATAVTEGSVFILSYWNDRFFRELKGLRTVAGVFRGGVFTVYNTHTDGTEARTYRTLPEVLRGKKLILGYLFS